MRIIFLDRDKEEIEKLTNRPPLEESALQTAKEIIEAVRKRGDSALLEFTRKFDSPHISQLEVTEEEIESALSEVKGAVVSALNRAIRSIVKFHRACLRNTVKATHLRTADGVELRSLVRPLKRVGLYIPGGRASYPSTVLMTAIPARVAGVEEIIMCSPPRQDGSLDPLLIVAGKKAGVDRIFKVGGAQAIAGMAFGTETIPKVDKIVGPGGAIVASAKKEVFGYVNIEGIAGPSEVLILCDETANPRFVALDLLAQAEHDPLAWAVLVTTSPSLAQEVLKEVTSRIETLERKEIIRQSLEKRGYVVIAKDLSQAVAFANAFAPEHLQIILKEEQEILGKIENAGAIFLGNYSPTAVGDYMAGPSHTLPTGGTARFFSPLSIEDFLKRTSVIKYSRERLKKEGKKIMQIALEEGFSAHSRSIEERLKE